MFSDTKKVALILVLSFFTANADHHSHDHNHQDHKSHNDLLSAFDHHFHEYHHHHPIEQPNCGQVCPKNLPKFQQFEVGQVYTVDLDGQTLVNIKEGQTIDIKSKIDVHVVSPCEFSLTLRDTQVSGVPNPQELAKQLDSSPALRFGAHDGKVLGVCPSPQEEIWTLNIKKSILSAMQLTAKDLSTTSTVEEVDFSGHCTTTYRPISDTPDTSNLILEKSKDLNKCHLRRKNIAGFKSKSLTLLTEFLRENLPILKSNQKCLQEIRKGHLFSVKCTEEQRISFQNDNLVVSSLNLQFAGKAPASVVLPAATQQTAETLLMSRDNDDEKAANEADVLNLLKSMCTQVSGDHLSPDVTESFHTLVRALRTLPEAGTRTLDKATKTNEICQSSRLRQLFLGASAFAASDSSIQTLIAAYKNKELSEVQISILLSIVSLKTKPSEKTIEQFLSLIEPKNSERALMIGTSLMVRNFCKKNENCLTSAAIQKYVTALINKMDQTDCNLERITAIIALDNVRPKTIDNAKNALLNWAQKPGADIGVRVAAIKALKRVADDNIKQKLIDIVLKDEEPSEVRISAYRSVVMSGVTLQQLEALKSENDPQIKNYIQTHISNLKNSKNANRRALLPEGTPDFGEARSTGLGVTRNVQWSVKNMTMEINVVHPKGSMVPSLYTFELWFPMADKEYQLLEIQLRQEGLSQRFQNLMSRGIGGPEVLMQLSEEVLELMTTLKDPNHKHSTVIQLSVRMSGNNVVFFDTLEDLHRLGVLIKQRLRELYDMDKVDLARGLTLLDSEVEVPTLVGLPMVLHLNETIIMGVKGEKTSQDNGGNKLRKVKSSRTYLDELSAGLKLKVQKYRPGFEYHVRFELNPSNDMQVEKIDGRIIKAKINLPNERKSLMKLVQSTRLIDANGVPKDTNEISGRVNDESVKCRQIFGMNVCRSKVWLDNSPIPNIEYYATKEDPALSSIELTLERPPATATRDLMVWSAKVNAGKREYSGQFELRNPKEGPKKANLKLVSPVRTITADTSLFNSADGNTSKFEFDLKLPNVVDVNSQYNFEQKGEQKNVDLKVDYQLAGADRKETIRWNRKSLVALKKEKKSKIYNVELSGELKSTQFPEYNIKMAYNTNLKPYQNTKSDLKVEWGPQYQDRVRLTYNSKMDIIEIRPFQMISENNIGVEITPLDINHEFTLNSDISMAKTKPKLISLDLVGTDKSGKNRNIKGSLKYERIDQPIQQTINASLSYPGRDITLYSEVNQIKDLSFKGKMLYSPEKGKLVTVLHEESITNPTKDFYLKSEAEVSYNYKPDKFKTMTEIGWETADKFEYKFSSEKDGQKYNQLGVEYNKNTQQLEGKFVHKDKQASFKVDNVKDPRKSSLALRVNQKSYKFSAERVPRESLTVKLDESENSRLKELKAKVSRKEKSTLTLVYNNVEVNSYLDLISKDKKAHLDFKCPEHNIDHNGDIILNAKDRKITWKSITNKEGKAWLTLESQFSRDKTMINLKKIKGPDSVSRLDYTREKGVYAAEVDTSRWSGKLSGEYRDNKNYGRLTFKDKTDNIEHTSNYNVSNGVITVKSVGDNTKLDATIGCKIVSKVNLVTPKIKSELVANPLGEKKTLVFTWTSPRYDQNTNMEWVPRKYLKVNAISTRKDKSPPKIAKVDAYLTRTEDSSFKMTAPQLDVDIKRVRTPKPKFIFNTTINGYNEVQEFDSYPILNPTQNLMVALKKWSESYISDN